MKNIIFLILCLFAFNAYSQPYLLAYLIGSDTACISSNYKETIPTNLLNGNDPIVVANTILSGYVDISSDDNWDRYSGVACCNREVLSGNKYGYVYGEVYRQYINIPDMSSGVRDTIDLVSNPDLILSVKGHCKTSVFTYQFPNDSVCWWLSDSLFIIDPKSGFDIQSGNIIIDYTK